MKEGMLFIWAEKELISEILDHFEGQGFEYVENMVYVMLDADKKQSVERFNNTDATPAIGRESYRFIRKGHKTLLFLRRSWAKQNKTSSENKVPLELRHQRTGDVVFDWIDPANPFKKPEYYVYKLIETLLPKAHAKLLPAGSTAPTKVDEARALKMVELWAHDDTPRQGWLKVCSLR